MATYEDMDGKDGCIFFFLAIGSYLLGKYIGYSDIEAMVGMVLFVGWWYMVWQSSSKHDKKD